MPDIQEVYEMVTKQKPPEPGALERQQKRQVRAARNKRFGAFAVAAAIGVVAIALILVMSPGEDTTAPADGPTVEEAAEEVARDFLDQLGAFNAEQAMTYLAEDSDIRGMTEGYNDVEGLSLMLSFLEAQGYQQTITSCEATTLDSFTTVVCAYDFHGIRSDEIGRGPFSGGTFSLTVRDGEIVRASRGWNIEEFSPHMWEPFAEWVSTTYPKDAAVMYNSSLTNFVLTEESIRLWEKRSREWVKVVLGTQGQ